ncbi:hypothetical protein C2S53_017550 [Perilla frutescens var. hirtella]|uniref:Uncharacterized protein n=1 Tax=Perilla frutescens var. hirtella TaxID=608512 RepID=A0AAD4P3I4_PERFH|nr:hypothetical protein C2S53_017550 [Perilla frutescens var. hirtella]
MPSGAKKRKAAKKKKENQNQPNNSAHGDEGVKQHDDRESDVGEVSSPTSEDRQKLPMEGEDEEIEKDSGVTGPSPTVEGSRFDNGKEQVRVEESLVKVEKDIKIEDELSVKDGIVDYDEANSKAYDGGSSGSSGGGSSSSDDESHGIKKEQAESSIALVESVDVADSYVVVSTLEENGGKKFSSVCTSEPSVNAASLGKEEANLQSSECTPTTLDSKECVSQEDDRSTSPYIAPRAAEDNGAQHMKDHVVTQPVVAPPFPHPVQKTSWKSCCGLFEVFSGSAA